LILPRFTQSVIRLLQIKYKWYILFESNPGCKSFHRYSTYIYNPIGRLATKVRNQIAPDSGRLKNPYQSIDHAVIELFNKNIDLMSKYQTTFPYFKQYSVNNLLSSEVFEPEQFTHVLNQLGIQFIYSRYVNVVMDFENTEFSEKERGFLDSALSGFKQEITYVIFSINISRAAMIINTDMGNDSIYNMMVAVKKELNGKKIELTISLGNSYDSINHACARHREVLAQIDGKFFTGKNHIILSKNSDKIAREFAYDKNLEEELLAYIHAQNKGGAVQVFNRLIDKIVSNDGSIEYIRYVYFQVIYHVLETGGNIGIDFSKLNLSSAELFDNILRMETLDDLREFAEDTLLKCIMLIDEYRKIQHEIIAGKVAEFLKSNFNHDISLNEVAKEFFLSPGHLNYIFKTATGFTIYEYITKIRMEASAELLVDSDFKIHDIAERVGYKQRPGRKQH
jgi:two-component system response regulator YesN